MGRKLIEYYEMATAKGGLAARMRLAIKTGISLERAGSESDSEENLELFFKAAQEVIGPSVPKL